MTDVSKLGSLANAISSSSPAIKKYAIEQARVSVSQEADLQKLRKDVGMLLTGAGAPPAAGVFGASLPARIGSSTGSTTNVASISALTTALGAVSNGDIINITANLDFTGTQYNISRSGAAGLPITITCNPGVTIKSTGQAQTDNLLYVTGSYLRFLNLDISIGGLSGIKFDGAADHNEIDGCHIHHNLKQGILVACTTPPTDIQIWNCTINDNGSVANGGLDHGIYFATASSSGNCVIANCLIYHNCAMGIQVYPDSPNVIVTCCTIDDAINAWGGIVIGSGSAVVPSTNNVKVVGCLLTNAPYYGIWIYQAISGDVAYDCLASGNANDYMAASGMTYTNCVNADPSYTNRASRVYTLSAGSPAISAIQSARFGYVPPFDKNGVRRTTADAGCFAH